MKVELLDQGGRPVPSLLEGLGVVHGNSLASGDFSHQGFERRLILGDVAWPSQLDARVELVDVGGHGRGGGWLVQDIKRFMICMFHQPWLPRFNLW